MFQLFRYHIVVSYLHKALVHAAGRVMSIRWATTLVAKTCSAIWVVQQLIQNVINLQKQKALPSGTTSELKSTNRFNFMHFERCQSSMVHST